MAEAPDSREANAMPTIPSEKPVADLGSGFWKMNVASKPIDAVAIQRFLTQCTSQPSMSAEDTKRVCTTLQALTWRIQQTTKVEIKQQIQGTFATDDLLGCLQQTECQTLDSLLRCYSQTLDSLLRCDSRQVKSFTFSLLNTLASYQEGKKYLLQKADLLEILVDQLCMQSHLNALATLPSVKSQRQNQVEAPETADEHQAALNESHSHRTLLSVLFKFSQCRKSHDKLMKSAELVSWVLTYMHLVCGLFTRNKHPMNPARNLPGGVLSLDGVPLAVSHTFENALGLLQNISLKPQGMDRILHFKPPQTEQEQSATVEAGSAEDASVAGSGQQAELVAAANFKASGGQSSGGPPLNAIVIMQNILDTACFLQRRAQQFPENESQNLLLTLLASTYANSVLYSLVSKSKGRSQARKSNLKATMTRQLDDLLQMYDRGEGHKVDQPTLIQYQSILDLMSGDSSQISSSSGSLNTSLDDWSDDESDDSDIDWQTEHAALGLAGQVSGSVHTLAQVSEEWLAEEFKAHQEAVNVAAQEAAQEAAPQQ